MIISDINFYSSFMLNPFGIITNYQSYRNYLIGSLTFYSMTSTECLGLQLLTGLTNGRDMYYQQTNQCIKDYNIYHNLINFDCQSEDKMISITALNNDCLDCIEECDHCGGESELNCACYYNGIKLRLLL